MYQGKSGLLLSGVIMILTGFLIFLTLFQGPSMDDFVGRYYFDALGYIDGVKAYLTHGNSRYFSLPVFIGASASYFLIDHYYLVLIAGIILTLWCLYYFIKSVTSIILTIPLANKNILLASGFLFLFFCSVVRELPSFIYWFATTITYLVPFGLFLVIAAMILHLKPEAVIRGDFNDSVQTIANTATLNRSNKIQLNFPVVFSLLLLKIIVGGSNELILFYSMYLTFLLTLHEFFTNKKLTKLTWLLIGIDLLILIAVFLIPGASSRSHDFSAKQSIMFSMAGAGFRVYQLMLHIFSNALFWVVMIFIVWSSKYVNPLIINWVHTRKKSGLLLDLLLILFPIFFFIFFIRHFGGEVVPPRAENIMICITVLMLYAAIFFWVLKFSSVNDQSGKPAWINKMFTAGQFLNSYNYILALVLILSPLTYGILQNLLFLPPHKRVLDKRVSLINDAKNKGENSVRIPSYKPMMDEELEKQFGQKGADFFRAEFSIPPSFSYFKDDPNNPSNNYAYAEYYKIDSMIVDTAVVKKWSLTDKLLFGAP